MNIDCHEHWILQASKNLSMTLNLDNKDCLRIIWQLNGNQDGVSSEDLKSTGLEKWSHNPINAKIIEDLSNVGVAASSILPYMSNISEHETRR